MKNSPFSVDRRSFLKTGAFAVGATSLGVRASAATLGNGATLPELGYSFSALEPHIDAKTMEIHHGKHHAAYVKALNAALEKSSALKQKSLDELMPAIAGVEDEAVRTALRNNGGGHWNHSFFWKSLIAADKQEKPSAELAKAIDTTFESHDAFQKSFGEAAAKRFGSGWAWLIVQNGKLKITSTPNQDNPLMKGIVAAEGLGTPLLGLDVWEHAYYLNYQNRRPDYISAFWNVVDWKEVSRRFSAAS